MGNLTRIIGGVIAAGAVAAGASAFTAPGVDTTSSLSTNGIVGGGSVNITVHGLATVLGANVIQPILTPNQVTGVLLDVRSAADGTSALPGGSQVAAKLTGLGGNVGAATTTWITCSPLFGKYSCPIPTSKYYTSISNIEIAVVAANNELPTS